MKFTRRFLFMFIFNLKVDIKKIIWLWHLWESLNCSMIITCKWTFPQYQTIIPKKDDAQLTTKYILLHNPLLHHFNMYHISLIFTEISDSVYLYSSQVTPAKNTSTMKCYDTDRTSVVTSHTLLSNTLFMNV